MKSKGSQKITLELYWNKERTATELIDVINFNKIKNVLEIGCAAGGTLRQIQENCLDVQRIYGTEFNKKFINFGNEMIKKSNYEKINIFHSDILTTN